MKTFFFFLSIGSALKYAEAKTPPWPSPYWDIPGDYCRARYPERRCCEGRNDPCSVPILGTLCYCDKFCNRTGSSDCCPDYFSHCEGFSDYQYAVQRPEELVRPEDIDCPHGIRTGTDSSCYFEGRYVTTRDSFRKNCNQCRCQVSTSNPQCMEVLCETEECFMDGDLFSRLEDDFYRGYIHWRPKNNSVFWGHRLSDIANKRLGTRLPEEWDKKMFDMIPIKFHYDASQLPQNFDARHKWPEFIHPVLDQGWCAASWAFSTISVASDRMAIDSDGKMNYQMSPQSLIACNTHNQFGCQGGFVDRAWHFLRKIGTVPDSCYPYEESHGYCHLPRSVQHKGLTPEVLESYQLLKDCDTLSNRKGLFKMQPSYRVGRRNTIRRPRRTEQDIMYEIMNHGPVQAIMEVYKDFFLYGNGIYERSHQVSGQSYGFHSVKIIGWGSERGIDYWIVANSWGPDWGDNGYFQIRRGSDECQIESQVVGAWAQTQEVTEEIEKFQKGAYTRHRRSRQRRRHRRYLRKASKVRI